MNEAWWEKPMCFICNFWWLILGFFVLLLTSYFTSSFWLPHVIPDWGATATPSGTPRVENFENPYLTPGANIPAMVGTEVPTETVNDHWQTYNNPIIEISLKYPGNWKLQENEDKNGFSLYPPDSDINMPSPHITFNFLPDHIFDETTPISADKTGYQAININNFSGMEYQDDRLNIPGQNYYIELAHKQGTISISATMGPHISLVNQLREILNTLGVLS
ncbi:MAG: hypothetical protein WCI88_01710 [Chloroflexota bacterium]